MSLSTLLIVRLSRRSDGTFTQRAGRFPVLSGPAMILMPDGDPELKLLPAIVPPDEDFLPALSGDEDRFSPARAYLLSLNSSCSRQTMAWFLGIIAGMLEAASLESCHWGSLRHYHVMAVIELLRDIGRATARFTISCRCVSTRQV